MRLVFELLYIGFLLLALGGIMYRLGGWTYRWWVSRGAFLSGGPVPGTITVRMTADTSALQAGLSKAQQSFTAGQILSSIIADTGLEPPVPLVESWSNEKVEAWRVIPVTVQEGDPDGLWLGHPHPDGPTPDVVTPVQHPVGELLHAECGFTSRIFLTIYPTKAPVCDDVPGEHCRSGVGHGCGFYAFKTHADAVQLARGISAGLFGSDHRQAVARVLLSGKVIEHKNGYRAEILEVVDFEDPAPVVDMFMEATAAIIRLGASVNSHPFIRLGDGT